MQPVPTEHLVVAGALDEQGTAEGVVQRRFPAWTRHQILDPRLDLMVSMPSGVRYELLTDSDTVEVDVHLTHLQVGEYSPGPGVFDVVVDGSVGASVSTTEGTKILYDPFTLAVDFVPGPSTTMRFDDLAGNGMRRVEIWLPPRCVVAVGEVRVVPGSTTEAPGPSGRRRWVHYGSSISHCLEADRPTGTWPAVAARLGDVELRNLAVAGQCHLDQMVARTIRDLDVDLISVKAGINVINADTMRERTFVPAVHGFLDTVRDGHPTTPLLVVSPIVCPVAEDHPGPTVPLRTGVVGVVERPKQMEEGALTLRRIRELLTQIVDDRRRHGDPNLHLLDGLDLFGPDDADGLPDGLHPDAAGYQKIGERFAAKAFAPGAPFAPT
jgi:hypothetical protein